MYSYLCVKILFRFADNHVCNLLVLYRGCAVSRLWKIRLKFRFSLILCTVTSLAFLLH